MNRRVVECAVPNTVEIISRAVQRHIEDTLKAAEVRFIGVTFPDIASRVSGAPGRHFDRGPVGRQPRV